ncbi:putative deoxyribonuclease RhsC [Phytobacter ursingii]|nr:putative deoxyribonuclease RhsC [Phytobacter ursingii]
MALLDGLEGELLSGDISEQSRQWLAQCGLTAERIRNQLEPVHIPQRTLHLYHCDHRGLPLALINEEGQVDWSADYDAWGTLLSENNPHSLVQDIRLPGQQYDEETGLHYNRHRYYNPRQGRYITQDPIGIRGGWNLYAYPLDPLSMFDPYGLKAHQYSLSMDRVAENILRGVNSTSICESSEYAGLICAKKISNDILYYASHPNKGNKDTSWPFRSPCDNGDQIVAWYHTHGSFDQTYGIGNETFSNDDFLISIHHKIDAYLATPNGDFRKYDYGKNRTNSINSNMPSQCNKR